MIFGSTKEGTPRQHLRAFVSPWVITVGLGSALVGTVFAYQGQFLRASLLVLFWLPSLIGWRTLIAGNARSAALILVYGYAFALAVNITVYNGIYAPAVAMLPVLAIIASVLLGPVQGMWLGLASGLLLVGLAIMGSFDLPIPLRISRDPVAILTVELCLLAMSTLFAYCVAKAVQARFNAAMEQEEELSKQLEQEHIALLDSQQRLKRIAESAPAGIFQWLLKTDGQSSYPYTNQQMAAITGVEASDLAIDAQVLIDRFHPDDWHPLSADEIDRRSFSRRLRARNADDEWIWIQIMASGEVTAEGSMLWSGFLTDVSEQVQVEQELEAARAAAESANHAKSAFLAHMSHEIRTPMNGVLGMSELLAQTELDERQREYIGTVRNSGRNLMEVIDSILDFSKIEAGKMEVRPVSFSLSGLMREVVSLYSATAAEKGLDLRSERDPVADLRLLADRSLVYRILTNLVNNAIKFTEAGSVTLSCRWKPLENGQVALQFLVSDTGPGIPKGLHHRLFKAFSQVPGNDSSTIKGTGLGLALCKQCTDLIGGSLELLDVAQPGAHFELRFLAGISDDESANNEPSTSAITLEQGYPQFSGRALVAEDEPVNQAVVSSMLVSLGMSAELADDGAQALAMAEALLPDVLLLDCQMPNLDGYAVARAMRAHDKLRQIPIIAVTAHAFADNAERAFAAGVDVFLTKPITRKALAQSLWTLSEQSVTDTIVDLHSSPLWLRPRQTVAHQWAPLARHFCDDQGPAILDVLRECLQAGETDSVSSLCAKLASACESVGALRLARSARAYAQDSHLWMRMNVDRLPALVALLTVTADQLDGYIKSDSHLPQ